MDSLYEETACSSVSLSRAMSWFFLAILRRNRGSGHIHRWEFSFPVPFGTHPLKVVTGNGVKKFPSTTQVTFLGASLVSRVFFVAEFSGRIFGTAKKTMPSLSCGFFCQKKVLFRRQLCTGLRARTMLLQVRWNARASRSKGGYRLKQRMKVAKIAALWHLQSDRFSLISILKDIPF